MKPDILWKIWRRKFYSRSEAGDPIENVKLRSHRKYEAGDRIEDLKPDTLLLSILFVSFPIFGFVHTVCQGREYGRWQFFLCKPVMLPLSSSVLFILCLFCLFYAYFLPILCLFYAYFVPILWLFYDYFMTILFLFYAYFVPILCLFYAYFVPILCLFWAYFNLVGFRYFQVRARMHTLEFSEQKTMPYLSCANPKIYCLSITLFLSMSFRVFYIESSLFSRKKKLLRFTPS